MFGCSLGFIGGRHPRLAGQRRGARRAARHRRRRSSAASSRGPNGPEAGVWVIAETTDLPTRFARIVVTDDRGPLRRARSAEGQLQRLGARLRPRRFAEGRGEPGRSLNLTAAPAPSAAAAAQYYPAIYWYSMLKIPPASEFGGKSDIPAKRHAAGLAQRHEEQRLHRLPSARPAVDAHHPGEPRRRSNPPHEAWMRRVQSGQAGEQMVNPLAGELGGVPFKYFGDWTDRIAKGELPHAQAGAAAGRRAQHRRHLVGLARREALPARPHLDRPPLPDGQRLRPALRLDRVLDRHHADPRSEDAHGHDFRRRRCATRHAGGARAGPRGGRQAAHALAVLGRREDLGHARPTTTTGCSTGRAACGSPRPVRGADNPDFCKKGSDHPVGQAVPARAQQPPARRCSTRRP